MFPIFIGSIGTFFRILILSCPSKPFLNNVVLSEDQRNVGTMPHVGSFSITAPRFTAAEETEERLALSSEEREKVAKDLFGGDPNALPEEEKHLSELISQVRIAIDNIHVAEKQEYLRAQQICPHLVEKESDPVRFLRCDNYHAEVRGSPFRFQRISSNCSVRHMLISSQSFVIHHSIFTQSTSASCQANCQLLGVSCRAFWRRASLFADDPTRNNGR